MVKEEKWYKVDGELGWNGDNSLEDIMTILWEGIRIGLTENTLIG